MEASSHRRSGLMTEEIFFSINKKRSRGVCEAYGFRYRHAAGPARSQCADKRVSCAVGVDQFHQMRNARYSAVAGVIALALVAVIMSHTPFRVAVRMIGSNEKATRYSGVATDWMLVGVYVVSSLLSWVAAMVMMARFNSASAGYAESYLLITILCRIIKSRTRSIFVLLLLDNVHDQLNAFELGAVDCVMKPFSLPKLVRQVRNLLWSIGDSVTTEALKVGDLLLDRARHEVRAANCVVNCTPKEFLLLGVLMERSGRVQTREQLLNDVWDNDPEIAPRAIDRHVCCLRAKLGSLGRYIETIPSAGYRLVPDGQITA